MLQNSLIYRTARLAFLILIVTGLNFRLMAEIKDLPNDLTSRITIKVEKVSLKNALDLIAKKGKLSIIYSNSKDLTSTVVSVDAQNKMIKDVFDDLLAPLSFDYKVVDDKIVISHNISKLKPSKVGRVSTNIPLVKGKITDPEGNPLPGATVKIKGGQQATATDQDGLFFLKNIDEGAIILITVIGYSPKELNAEPDLGIITLEISSSKLSEVKINAGYYSVTDRERTGDISKVTAETIGEQPINNPLLALEGRVPGLQITQTTGVPGGGITVRIRGQNSIRSGNDPLYIIDGVTYPSTGISGSSTNAILGTTGLSPLSMINPSDIESIEVLKDADATAIYGSRGANGVILVTTKRGKEGSTKVNGSVSRGVSQVAHHVDLLNTQQYVAMRKEALKNDGLQIGTSDYDINGTWDLNKYTDWQKELIGGNAPTTNASVSVTGGNIKSNYLVGGSYYSEGTVYAGDFGFKRIGIRSSINVGAPTDRLTMNFTANYNHTQSNLFAADLSGAILLPPNAPDVYDQYGQLNWANNTVVTNPMANLLQTNDASTDNLVANVTFNYRLLKDLIFKTSLGYNSIKRQEVQKTPLTYWPAIYNFTSSQRSSLYGNEYNNNWIIEPQLNYKSKLGVGIIDALVGMSFQNNDGQITVLKGANYNSDDLLGNIASAGTITSSQNDFNQYRYTAVFARLNYSINDKYFLNATARRDGSSRFGPGKQFANFGAIGAGWIFSEENLIKNNLNFLTFGKLRASYGVTGNDQIANYGYLQLFNTGATYQGSSTLTPATTAPNADFAWETNRKFEAALQLGFFKDLVNIEFSVYRNRSSNLLLYKLLPLSSGLAGTYMNLPAEVQNSGIEMEADFKILKSKNLQWSAGLNLTIPKSKLLSYPGLETSGDAINYQVGEPLSILKVYNIPVNPQTGLYQVEDKNGNGAVDNADRYITRFIGQSLYGGLQNSLRYKQFTLDFLFSFTKQTGLSYRSVSSVNPGRWLSGLASNQFSQVLSRWQQPGDQTSTQKFSTTSANNSLNFYVNSTGDQTVVDASYIRLKNVALSWSLPKKILSCIGIDNATFTLQGQNVFTLTNYVGLDPETQSLRLPPLRTIMAGINLKF